MWHDLTLEWLNLLCHVYLVVIYLVLLTTVIIYYTDIEFLQILSCVYGAVAAAIFSVVRHCWAAFQS